MKTKILIVEHDSNEMELIQQELEKGDVNYIAETVQTKIEYKKALHTFQPDIILSNNIFPSFDGLTALKIREKLVPDTPFIFVAESIDKENTDALIKNRVTAFVPKKRFHTLIDKMNLALQQVELTKINTLFEQSQEKRIEELAQNESKFQSLVESSMDAILLTEKNGKILTANAAACEIFEMTEEEIITAGRFGLTDNMDPRLKLLIEERQHTGRAKGEITFIRKDGNKFPGEISSALFTDAYGQEKSSMIIRDITERKQAEQTLTASQLFNKGILDSLTSHIAVINSKGIILKVNKSWNSFAEDNGGNSTEKYGEGANYFDACCSQNNSADDLGCKALKGIKDVLNGEINEFYLEYPCHSPMTERWFNMRVKIFESSETMVLIEHHDISERKLAEQKLALTTNALKEALKERNNILDSCLDVICTFDKDRRFVSVSGAAETIWGYKPEELLGKNYIDFVFQEDKKSTVDESLKIRRGIPVTMFENRYIHKNGKIIPMLWSSRWDEQDQLSYAIGKNATEKKYLEKAFEIERQSFMDLYLQIPSCMGILKGPNHVYELANPLYLQLIDKKEDIIGKTVKEVLPELEAQGIFEFLDTVYKTGKTFLANEMLVKFDHHGNGQLVDTYLNFMYQAHRDSEGSVDGIFFFANDVTEQVLSRKKIEESVLRYTSLIEQASDAICFVDSSLKIIDVNHYACEKLGYSRADFFQLSVADFYLEEDLKANPLKMDAIKEGKTVRGERRIKRKDGTLIDMELSAKILRDGGMIIFGRDIREQKKAQLELMESEEKYRFLFENNPMPMWIIDDITSKFMDVNDMAILRYGYSREEFLSMSALDIRPEEDKGRYTQSKNYSEIDGKNFNNGVWNHLNKNGTVIPVEIIAQKIIYQGVAAKFILSNDITNRRKAELSLEQQNKELTKTNSELDRFVYSVSHDLRSPLTSILGLLSFIEEETQEDDTLEHTKMIRNSINRLDDFIKNILSYSRNNRTSLEIEKIPVQQTIATIVDLLQSMKQARGIHFEIDIQEIQPFYSDTLRFKTILENLISNAIKYHKKNQVDRFIRITGHSNQDNLEFSVTDNGIGISPVHHSKIFDMFFRISGKTDGSGIGLYIVKETIDKLEGSIMVQSELNTGTKFTITLKNLTP